MRSESYTRYCEKLMILDTKMLMLANRKTTGWTRRGLW